MSFILVILLYSFLIFYLFLIHYILILLFTLFFLLLFNLDINMLFLLVHNIYPFLYYIPIHMILMFILFILYGLILLLPLFFYISFNFPLLTHRSYNHPIINLMYLSLILHTPINAFYFLFPFHNTSLYIISLFMYQLMTLIYLFHIYSPVLYSLFSHLHNSPYYPLS